MAIRVIIADDHQLFREGIANMMAENQEIEVVAQTEDGEETVQMVEEHEPDIVLMDINMPRMNGLEASTIIQDKHPETKVIALSMYADKHYIRGMLELGVQGYLFKDCTYDQLTSSIKIVNAGKKYMSDKITEVLVQDYLGAEEPVSSSASVLSDREGEVLKLIAEGFSSAEISDKLFISVKTVSTHKQNLLEKLDLKSNADIIKYAIRNGITSL
jgi:two-component system, NarL family, response regulator NreC